MKTPKSHIYSKHTNQLEKPSRLVNYVWNHINKLNLKHLQKTSKFLSAYNPNQNTKGAVELGLHSQIIQAINKTHAKAKHKNLDWLPFKNSAIKHLKTDQTSKKALTSKPQLSLTKEQKLTTKLTQKLAKAQKAKKKRIKTTHTKIKHSRLNAIHQFTSKLAKPVYNASWYELKRQLGYKSKYVNCLLMNENCPFTRQGLCPQNRFRNKRMDLWCL